MSSILANSKPFAFNSSLPFMSILHMIAQTVDVDKPVDICVTCIDCVFWIKRRGVYSGQGPSVYIKHGYPFVIGFFRYIKIQFGSEA